MTEEQQKFWDFLRMPYKKKCLNCKHHKCAPNDPNFSGWGCKMLGIDPEMNSMWKCTTHVYEMGRTPVFYLSGKDYWEWDGKTQ